MTVNLKCVCLLNWIFECALAYIWPQMEQKWTESHTMLIWLGLYHIWLAVVVWQSVRSDDSVFGCCSFSITEQPSDSWPTRKSPDLYIECVYMCVQVCCQSKCTYVSWNLILCSLMHVWTWFTLSISSLYICVCVCAGLEWVTLAIRFHKCVCVHVCSGGAFCVCVQLYPYVSCQSELWPTE